MAVFISYSHSDRQFVEQLAEELVHHNTNVWVDRWELNVGDSLLQRVQEAIQNASALIVVLSKASVVSEWCKKEMSAGLLKELEERRVVVLPALVEDCEIPIFLREKMYADFRSNFDDGFRDTLAATAKVTSDSLGRIDTPDFHTDWAVDWTRVDELFLLRTTSIQQTSEHSVLTEFTMLADQDATRSYQQYKDANLDWFGRQQIIEVVANSVEQVGIKLLLEDSSPQVHEMLVADGASTRSYLVQATCRRLGQDNGKDVLVDAGALLSRVRDSLRDTERKPTVEEMSVYLKLVRDG